MTLKSDRYGIIVEIRNGSALTQPLEGGAWRARGKMVQTLTLFWLTRGRVSNDPEEATDPYGLAEGCTAPGFLDTRRGYQSMTRATIVAPGVTVRSRFASTHRHAAIEAARAAAGV